MENPSNKTSQNMGKASANTGREKDSMTGRAGDTIERLGEKLKHAGAEKVGQAVYNAGNKIEHMGDNKGKV